MRRVIATVVGTVIGLVLLLSFKTHPLTSAVGATPPAAVSTLLPSASSAAPSSAAPSAAPSSATDSSNVFGEPSPASSSSAAPTTTSKAAKPAPTTTTKAATKQTVTGDAVDTMFGPVQVQLTVSGGEITAANAVEYPTERQRDVEINQYAVPVLDQEVLQAQSAQIDAVSGATYTSQGYLQSLQSALDKAGVKG
jgi:uncharacterized protein with FMN-binding domain